ncbi:MAG: hypothetical protein IJ711_08430 [Lachnospiraceae bacterium]|nr:hypothetical protein [Lachnospiraceae bacterium]
MDDFNRISDLDNRPLVCEVCGGVMIFEGVGEYHCEKCMHLQYDDYGKVRRYLEMNGVTNMALIAENTGVDLKVIRKMVKESRFTIAADSKTFLTCERCGCTIASGSLCRRCEEFLHKRVEEEEREKRHQKQTENMQGFERTPNRHSKGERRFER